MYVKSLFSKKAGLYGSVVTYELFEDRIVYHVNNNINTEILATAIVRVIPHHAFLLIYISEAYALFIPSQAFSNDAERSQFLEKLRQIASRTDKIANECVERTSNHA